MNNKICLITEVTSGIGLAISRLLLSKGAALVMLVRDLDKAEKIRFDLLAEFPDSAIEYLYCNLMSLQSVREAAQELKRKYQRVDVLINNAGAYFPKREITPEGIEATFAVNYLSHFLLSLSVLDLLKASAAASIINITPPPGKLTIDFDNLFPKKGYTFIASYAISKQALLMFNGYLAEKLKGTNIKVNAVHPGMVKTNLLNPIPPLMKMVLNWFSSSPEKAAEKIMEVLENEHRNTGEFLVKGKAQRPEGQAADKAEQEKLWNISLKLCHLTGNEIN